jgi:hypothetical protein
MSTIMEEVIPRLWVGDDAAYERVKDNSSWKTLRCCKFGPGGHKETLKYPSNAAPKGPDYLSVERPNRMALNYIDAHDPNLIPLAMVEAGLRYIDKQLAAGSKVLVACNAGHSRGPTTALLYLRAIGDLTGSFHQSENLFRTIYDKYDPGIGTRTFAHSNWDYFKNYLRKEN